ncbi:MAG: hypothetical protein ACLPX5_01830 [Dissulfurispiraceae bacterium]
MKNERGFALVLALVVSALLLALGGTALLMSQLGYFTVSSEKKFQLANWAAEYAVNSGVLYAVSNNSCPPSTGPTALTGGASYSYFSQSASNFCFIKGTGTIAGATVVKTVIVPAGGSAPFGALTLRDGGTLQLSGSSAISNCDTSCPTPGVVYGGTITQQITGGLHNTDSCPTNPQGIYGSPYATENSSGVACTNTNGSCSSSALPDQTASYFNTSSFSGLQTGLSTTYNGNGSVSVNASNLSITSPTTPPATPAVSASCQCNCAVTLASSTTTCCTGGSQKTISSCTSIQATSLTINGIPANITQNLVSTGSITMQNVGGTINGVSFYGATGVTIQSASFTLNNSIISSSGGSITFQSSTDTLNNCTIAASGSVTLQSSTGNVNNSTVYGGSSVTFQGGSASSLSQSTVVTPGSFTFQSGNIADTNIFSASTTIQSSGNIQGGVLYTSGTLIDQSTGNRGLATNCNPATCPKTGSCCSLSSCDPTLFLSGGNMTFQDASAYSGLIFTNGSITDQGGASFNGSIASNSTTSGSTFQNANINFSPYVLSQLNCLDSIVKAPNCAGNGGQRKPYVDSTKMTIF